MRTFHTRPSRYGLKVVALNIINVYNYCFESTFTCETLLYINMLVLSQMDISIFITEKNLPPVFLFVYFDSSYLDAIFETLLQF